MKSSVFVRIDKYKEIQGIVGDIRSKLEDAKQLLKKIKDIKSQEDSELREWQEELATADEKLADISAAMTEK